MPDQATCRCPRPADLTANAAIQSGRCPVCGHWRQSPQSSPLGNAPIPATDFNWPGPRHSSGLENPKEALAIEVNTSPKGRSSKASPHHRQPDSRPAGRAANSQLLQQKVCRFLGIAIGLWSLFSLTPGGLAWQHWLADFSATILPLWMPANLVLASLPLWLGLLLFLVPDWASLQAVAAGLLAIASAYGFAATLFALAEADSAWLSTLGFPLSETKRATVWCLAMATLAGLLSFGCYREGQRWRRIGELLTQLLPDGERKRSISGSSDN